MIELNLVKTTNLQPTRTLADQAPNYIEKALECIKNSPMSIGKALILCKIAKLIKEINPEKASQLFKEAFTCPSNTIVYKQENLYAKMLHIMFKETFLDEAKKKIEGLVHSQRERDIITAYVGRYGGKDCPITEHCKKVFQSVCSRIQLVENLLFTKACTHFDPEYTLEKLQRTCDIDDIYSLIAPDADLLTSPYIDKYLNRINRINFEGNINLLKECPMNSAEYYKYHPLRVKGVWLTLIKEGRLDIVKAKDTIKSKGIFSDFHAHYFYNKILETVPITPQQFEDAKPYFAEVEISFRLNLWLQAATNLINNNHPEEVRKVIPELFSMMESCPKKSIFVMNWLIKILFQIDELEIAEKLRNHEIFQTNKVMNDLEYEMMEAEYYLKKNPIQAEKHYSKAWNIAKATSFDFQWKKDEIYNKIVNAMLALNLDRTLEIVKEMPSHPEIYKCLHLLD